MITPDGLPTPSVVDAYGQLLAFVPVADHATASFWYVCIPYALNVQLTNVRRITPVLSCSSTLGKALVAALPTTLASNVKTRSARVVVPLQMEDMYAVAYLVPGCIGYVVGMFGLM